jgi:hypothetical protein
MHPLVNNLSELKDSELYARINDLTKKYYMTRNPDLQWQMAGVLDDLRLEARTRAAEQTAEIQKSNNQSLDSLIKLS